MYYLFELAVFHAFPLTTSPDILRPCVFSSHSMCMSVEMFRKIEFQWNSISATTVDTCSLKPIETTRVCSLVNIIYVLAFSAIQRPMTSSTLPWSCVFCIQYTIYHSEDLLSRLSTHHRDERKIYGYIYLTALEHTAQRIRWNRLGLSAPIFDIPFNESLIKSIFRKQSKVYLCAPGTESSPSLLPHQPAVCMCVSGFVRAVWKHTTSYFRKHVARMKKNHMRNPRDWF